MYNMLKSGGHAVIDIGDSKFYGIHIPVDELLIDIGISVGFKLIESRFVRKRNSNDGSPLKQVLLIFKKI